MSIFITLEGGEGAGKTTQIKLLNESLSSQGHPIMLTREPGGTSLGEKIRSLILGSEEIKDPLIELLLLTAGRVDHINKLIKPALHDGKIVISDRFFHSTIVYQCLVKGLSRVTYDKISQAAIGNFKPNLTFYLDIDPLVAKQRLMHRGNKANHYDAKDIAFYEKIRSAFLSLSKEANFYVIDASRPPQEVHAQIMQILLKYL
jgi:dTMP kinase